MEQPPWPCEGPCVVAFWHEDLVPMVLLHAGRGLVGLTSRSQDGAIIAGVLSRLGYEVLRGSSSQGALVALRSCGAALKSGRSPALAVDGPRGPAYRLQPGAESLAKLGGVPVVYGVVEAPAWRFGSWDRMKLPWPLARVKVRYGIWRPGEGSLEAVMRQAAGVGAAPPAA